MTDEKRERLLENTKRMMRPEESLQPGDEVVYSNGLKDAADIGLIGERVGDRFALRPPENEGP